MGLQLGFGIHMYTGIHDFKKITDFDEDMGNKRVVECIHCTFYFLVLHSALVTLLIFFSFFKALLCPFVSWIRGVCWSCGGGCKGGCVGGGCGRTCCSLSRVPLMERVDRAQRAMEMGVTWYVHRHQHWYFTAVEAQAKKQDCGLQGYWFLSVKELVKQVGDHLPDLADENRYAASKRRGRKVGKQLTMALDSLLELSREQRVCDCGDDSSPDETASYLKDLPQTSRCRHDVDACRDFAQAGGYLVMLQVLNSCPEDSDDVHLAASILSGFAAGLSVLTWQPGQSQEIVEMLEHEDFCCCTRQVLKRLGKLMQRTIVPKGKGHCNPQTIVPKGKEDCNAERTQRLQEALVSAICSYAHAASDIAAHLQWHASKVARAGRAQASSVAQAGSAQASSVAQAGSAQGNGIVNVDDERKKHLRMLSNAFTTFCPVGWFLEVQFPQFQAVSDGWFLWLETVRWELTHGGDGIILTTLMDCASRPSDFPRKVVADSIRTLSSLFSRRMIYWHRFDMRHEELPDPFVRITPLKNSADLREGLKKLVVQCCNEDDPLFSVPVFSKLQLAKMLISQDIRDNDEKVVQVLLLCLRCWRRSLGAKELDWLACETVEMLRDVVRSSHNPAEISRFIASSPGGLECLTLMLQPRFPRIAAIRVDTEQDTSDAPVAPLSGDEGRGPSAEGQVDAASSSSSASKGAFRNLFRHVTDARWAGDKQVSIRYSAPAVGLLQDIITTTSGGDQDTREVLNQNFSAFLSSLMCVMMNLTNVKLQGRSLTHGSAEGQRCCSGPCGRSETGQACAKRWFRQILVGFVLLFVESLGHPAWHPPCSCMEKISSVSEEEQDNIIEHLELNVNILLGARYAVSLVNHLIDSRRERLSLAEVKLLIDPLLWLRQVRAPQLHLVLALRDWNEEIKRTITRLLHNIKPFIQGKVESSAPSQEEKEVWKAFLGKLEEQEKKEQQERRNRPQDEPTDSGDRQIHQARGGQLGTGRQKQGTTTSRPPSHPLTIGGAGAQGGGTSDQNADDNGDQLSHNRRQKGRGRGRGRGKFLPDDSDQNRNMELARKQNVSSAEGTNQGVASDATPSGRPILSTDGIDKSMQQASSSGDARDAGRQDPVSSDAYGESTSAQQSQHTGELAQLGSGSTSAQHVQETSDSTAGVRSTESSSHDASQASRGESTSAQENSSLTRLPPAVSGQADTADPEDKNGKRMPLLA
ncbi:hypothetical protein CBR_g55426 [Chara braunii]|uniref:Uncharacterized protein n=1 Tax=Chara braunii TaxID=69332 RepID=A0A388K816_CHABU|nr:hypothetical protein CBR_g55426 [Chara braunii]|eukprot:GBG66083.1 hypothetical protein CBR_g55426 [Chara braunii]